MQPTLSIETTRRCILQRHMSTKSPQSTTTTTNNHAGTHRNAAPRPTQSRPTRVGATPAGEPAPVVRYRCRTPRRRRRTRTQRTRQESVPVRMAKNRSKVLHTMTSEMKEWLEQEAEASGRSVSWLIENAVSQWRNRIEYGRNKRRAAGRRPTGR